MSIGLSNCRPTSRGHIRLRSARAEDHPVITANAFSTVNDVEEMLAAVKFLRQIAAQPTLARLIKEELRPGPEVVMDEALIEDFRARSTVYHPSCTCRMGRAASDLVVDAGLRVHGVGGLRVYRCQRLPEHHRGEHQCPRDADGLEGRGSRAGAIRN